MGRIGLRRWWIVVALVIIAGALGSCSDVASPQQPAATLTLIPASETPTPAPSATSTMVAATEAPTVEPTVNQTITSIALVQSAVTPEITTVQAILADLANLLEVDSQRIQVVSITEKTWYDTYHACNYVDSTMLDPADALRPTEEPTTGQEYLLLVGNTIYTYSVVDEAYERCPQTEPLANDLLTLVDSGAAEIAFLAQRQVANELSLSTRRVTIMSIRAYTWEDTSLGCPLPDQIYSEAAIDGYRVVVRAADTNYAFHSDAIGIYLCPEGQQQLP